MLDTLGCRCTLRICNTYCFSTTTMVTRTRITVTFIRNIMSLLGLSFFLKMLITMWFKVLNRPVSFNGYSTTFPSNKFAFKTILISMDLFVYLFAWASAASHGCTTASWLIVPPALDVPTFGHQMTRAYRRVPHSSGSWNLWAGNRTGNFAYSTVHCRNLLHAADLRHGTHGFTSLPKEGVLRIFPPLKIRRLRPGFETAKLGYQRPAR
jgi:hypothetical protein